MKKILAFLVFAGSVLFNTSCNKDFLETETDGILSEDLFYRNELDFNQAIYGAYSGLQIIYYYGGESGWQFVNILPDDDTRRVNQDDVDDFRWDVSYVEFYDVFGAAYKGITAANKIISNIPKANDFDPKLSQEELAKLKKQYDAEARFIRAYSYWYLATTFGPVPLVTEPVDVNKLNVGNSNVEEIYDLIINDLQIAEEGLPDSWSDAQRGRVTKYSAKAMLGKAYLYRANYFGNNADYGLAAQKLGEVISSGKFRLVENFNDNFTEDNENNSESLFEIQYAVTSDDNGWATDFTGAAESNERSANYAPTSQGGYGNELIPTAGPTGIADLYVPGDLRKAVTIYSDGDPYYGTSTYSASLSPTGHHVAKYMKYPHTFGNGFVNPTINPINERLIRYADVLLMYAEASNQANGSPSADAYNALNQVRRRAFGANITSPSAEFDLVPGLNQSQFFNELVLERRKELAFEGHRYKDLVRWHKANLINLDALMQAHGKEAWQERNVVAPMPQLEREVLPLLDQNPGY